MTPFQTARNHLGVELGPDATAAQVRAVAGRGFDYAVLPVAAATRIAPHVPGIGIVARGGAGVPGPIGDVGGWQPAVDACASGGSSAPVLVVAVAPGDPIGPAVRRADVVRVTAADLAAAGEIRRRVRTALAAAGRDPDGLPVLVDLDVHLTGRGSAIVDVARAIETGVRTRAADGFTLRPADPDHDLRRIAAELVPLLAGRGLFRPGPAGTLRERLALTSTYTDVAHAQTVLAQTGESA